MRRKEIRQEKVFKDFENAVRRIQSSVNGSKKKPQTERVGSVRIIKKEE